VERTKGKPKKTKVDVKVVGKEVVKKRTKVVGSTSSSKR
jgi:hypothetical protein